MILGNMSSSFWLHLITGTFLCTELFPLLTHSALVLDGTDQRVTLHTARPDVYIDCILPGQTCILTAYCQARHVYWSDQRVTLHTARPDVYIDCILPGQTCILTAYCQARHVYWSDQRVTLHTARPDVYIEDQTTKTLSALSAPKVLISVRGAMTISSWNGSSMHDWNVITQTGVKLQACLTWVSSVPHT